MLLALAVLSSPSVAGGDAPPGFLGIVVDLDPAGRVVAGEVMQGSPADLAGIRPGDLVLAVSGAAVRTPNDLVVVVMAAGAGATLRMELERAGQRQTVSVTLAERPTGPPSPGELEGQRAPPIEARAISPREGPIPTAGRVVVLDFWATWCVPCHMVMPRLAEWHRRFCPRGLTVLGVSSERRAEVETFVRRRRIPYTIGIDEGSRTATRFGIGALPTMVILDRAGNVRRVNVGADPMELDRTEALLETLLAEPAP